MTNAESHPDSLREVGQLAGDIGKIEEYGLRFSLERISEQFHGKVWPMKLDRFQRTFLRDEIFIRLARLQKISEAETFLEDIVDSDIIDTSAGVAWSMPRKPVFTAAQAGVFAALGIVKEESEWEKGHPPTPQALSDETKWRLGSSHPWRDLIGSPSEGVSTIRNDALQAFLSESLTPYIRAKAFPIPLGSLYHSRELLDALQISDSELSLILRGLGGEYWILVTNNQNMIDGNPKPTVNKQILRAAASFIWMAKQVMPLSALGDAPEDVWREIAGATRQELGSSEIADYLDMRTRQQREQDMYKRWFIKRNSGETTP